MIHDRPKAEAIRNRGRPDEGPGPGIWRFTTARNVAGAAALLAAAAALVPLPAQAGPCTTQIVLMQAQVDAAIDTTAGVGQMGRESTGALLHHEPNPGSIGLAEETLGEGAKVKQALMGLAEARDADQRGDLAACERALATVRGAIGQ